MDKKSFGFTSYKYFKTERFKYLKAFSSDRVREKFNFIINFVKNCYRSVSWSVLVSDVSLFLGESLVDGLVVNYCLWVFINYDFNFKTILACGLTVKYLLYLWKTIKTPDGKFKTIHKN